MIRTEWAADETTFRLPSFPMTADGEAANARLVAQEDLDAARRIFAMRCRQLGQANRGRGFFSPAVERATVMVALNKARGVLRRAERAARAHGIA